MSKRNTVQASILSALALTMLCLCSSVVNAQKGPQGTTGTPLKGIDVKLGKNPGGNAAARTTTDSDGNFKFPVLPVGSYSLTLSRSKLFTHHTGDGTIEKGRQASQPAMPGTGEASSSTVDIKTCSITILGAEGGTKTEDWNLETNRIIIKSSGNNQRTTPGEDRINVVSDGKTPLYGTISKSRSNIKTNARTGNPN